MADKKKVVPPSRMPTKRQLGRWERERRSGNIILAAGSLVLVIVIALVGFGAYTKYVLPPREVAYKVNGKAFDMEYYVKAMRFVTYNGRSIQSATPDAMVNTIVDTAVIEQAAPGMGITVTDDEALEPMRTSYKSTLGKDDTFDEAKFKTWYQARAKDYGLSVSDLTAFFKTLALRTKLKDYVGKDLPANAPQVHLLGIESTDALGTTEIQNKLGQGQDFGDLAKASSIDSTTAASGGDLGWYTKDLLPADIADNVFSLTTGGLTQPINGKMTTSDPGGFWIFKVAEKQEDRPVGATEMDALKSKLALEWISAEKAKSQIENMVTNEKRAWALEQVPVQQ